MVEPDNELESKQVNPDKGTSEIIPQIGLSYNEWHAMIIGASIGVLTSSIIALTPTPFDIIATFIAVDKALAVTGKSITTDLVKTYPPTYAYIYNIRSEPWYYLATLVIFYILGLSIGVLF